jgi:uncharacterized protein with ACT and thioredoxin-like domain
MKNKFIILSLLFSITSIILTVKTNIDIVEAYLKADGKTKALFGIVEMVYDYKYFFLILTTISLILSLYSRKKAESKLMFFIAIVSSIVSVALIFMRIWTWII